MSVIGNPLLLGGDAGAPSFTTDRSVRLRLSNSAYFSRTPASASNRKTWTWSGWVKRGILNSSGAVAYPLFAVTTGTTDATWFEMRFLSDALYVAGYVTNWRVTTQVFRDPSAWYHIVLAVDTTQATANDRLKLYVNGVQVTTFSTTNNPTQNTDLGVNQAVGTYIGYSNTQYFDGYLTEVNFIDGQALTPSSFGEYDAVRNTQWKPKAYTGTYGTNGFYLKFADNSNNTAATMGKDSSGNSNNWTPNGISVTAGVTYDSMTDVPTLTSSTNANFATLNPLDKASTVTNGNLTTSSGAAHQSVRASFQAPSTGLYYMEATILSTTGAVVLAGLGLATSSVALTGSLASAANAWFFYFGDQIYTDRNGTGTLFGGTTAAGGVIQLAIDMANSRAWLGLNNVWYDGSNGTTGNPSAGTNPTFTSIASSVFPILETYSNTLNANFGQRPFTYTPPTGFKSLNTYNLPNPAVASSDDYHKIYSYTGNGGGLQVGEVQKPASLFNLDRSLRFRASNSAYLNRTLSTPTNTMKWTWSGWVKRGALTTGQLFSAGQTNTYPDFTGIYFVSDNLQVVHDINGTVSWAVTTTAVFRDPSLWYHVVVDYDSAQATGSNRVLIYVNGVLQVATGTYPLQNNGTFINTTREHMLGAMWGGATRGQYLDGYLADVYFIDGQALTPSDFGAYDGNYYWTPKAYTGTYGTNGFHLEFEDYSAATAAAIGKDTSGQGNNWTPTGINVTTPANTNSSWDSMVDVPTSTSADVANYCTLNPLRSFVSGSAATFTNGNLTVSIPVAANPPRNVTSTFDVFSGKWYWEVIVGTVATTFNMGIASKAIDFNASIFVAGSYLYDLNGNKNIGGTATAYGSSYTTNDVIGVALDMDAGTLTFYKNGVSQGVAATGLQGLTVTPVIVSGGASAITGTFNFGQRPFRYSNFGTDRPDATFKPINSFNIAEVTGDLESPDFVWIKSRSASGDHALFNSVVGTGKYFRSNSASAEVTDVNSLIQFNKNGFLLGNSAIVNSSAVTFVAAAWKAGNTTVTNTAGTISSQVRSNTTSGVSIVTWTGTGSNNPTIGHGLGKVPALIIAKNRDTSATDNNAWVYHQNIGTNYYILLTSPNLRATGALNGWVGTSPSDQTFTIAAGSTSSNNLNEINDRFEAICFAEINGFSKFGSYLSNNATDGPFVYTGFRPRWLMVKRAIAASGTGGWFMYDAERNTYNVMDKYMFAEGSAGDNTLAVFDFTSNGFKIRSNNVHVNTTAGDTYIYMAFAEHPFKYALAR